MALSTLVHVEIGAGEADWLRKGNAGRLLRFMRSATILLIAAAMLAAVSCGTPGAPMPPSLQLPQPVGDLKASRKGDKVTLTWTVPSETTDRATVKRLGESRVCRSAGEAVMNECGTPVGTLPAAQAGPSKSTTFVDTLPRPLQEENPAMFALYSIETQNDRGRSAGLGKEVRVPLAPTLPPPELHAQVTPEGPLLLWTGQLHAHEAPEIGHFFRVYRRLEGTNTDTVLGEVRLRDQPDVAMPDRNFDWEKTYIYRLAVVSTVTRSNQVIAEVEGDDSPPLKVFVHDVFPPAVPGGLQAVYSGLEQQRFIDLTWAPNTESDLSGYNVYRYAGGSAPAKINSELVKTPAFRDASVVPGMTYYYSVSAVDLRRNESKRSEEAHESVPE